MKRHVSAIGSGLALCALVTITGCGSSTTSQVEASGRVGASGGAAAGATAPLPMTLKEIPVTAHIEVIQGRGTLDPPTAPAVVKPESLLTTFATEGSPSENAGKVVTAEYGLYSDSAYGTQTEGGAFNPSLVKRPVWVLRVQGLSLTRSGPVDMASTTGPRANDGERITVFDAQTGDYIFSVEQGS